MDPAIENRMRAEWNERAKEDAHYYVAFGRRDQDDAEFYATAKDLVGELVGELKRLPAIAKSRRALEIGCGPGRLLRPLSQYFNQIYGVDVSDAMISLAKEKLADIPNAFPHAIGGSDLKLFPDRHFDFVYSYAVFQHIPDPEVVFSYLHETIRVLRPGGIARLQINGLPKSRKAYTTWEGVRVSADEIHALTREHGMELLALTGIDSQYMWTTWRKPDPSVVPASTATPRIRALSNAFSSEQAVPASGRLACVAASIENLPEGCDLNSLTAVVDGAPGRVCYVGPREKNGFSQINVFLPKNVRTGLLPIRLEHNGEQLAEEKFVRVIPPGPAVPRLTALTDAINLMSTTRIESGLIKASIEEVDAIERFTATVDGVPVHKIETFRADPLTERWEVNFQIPPVIEPGGRLLEIRLGTRILAKMGIEVVR